MIILSVSCDSSVRTAMTWYTMMSQHHNDTIAERWPMLAGLAQDGSVAQEMIQ